MSLSRRSLFGSIAAAIGAASLAKATVFESEKIEPLNAMTATTGTAANIKFSYWYARGVLTTPPGYARITPPDGPIAFGLINQHSNVAFGTLP